MHFGDGRFGGIVLCGGHSTRMGQPKAWLPWGEQTLLAHVVRSLAEVVSPVVVVAAVDQSLPELPPQTIIAYDAFAERGPLAGLEAGLAIISPFASAAFVTGCDYPLISPRFIETMCGQLGDHEIALPDDGEYAHPLVAVYRCSLHGRVQQHLREERLSLKVLCSASLTHKVPISELRAVDPDLHSLHNANSPESYEHAVRLVRNPGHS